MMIRSTTLALCGLLLMPTGCRSRGPADSASAEERPASHTPADPAVSRDNFNLLVVTIDTLRAQNLGCYGYFRDTSPYMDALAQRTLFFERCVTPMAQTLPSHASIMTGTYPLEHGALANLAKHPGQVGVRFVSTPTLRTLAEHLGDRGYRTWGVVSATPVKAVTGIATGFDDWSEPDDKTRRCEATLDLAEARLNADSQPFFGWIHFFDNHSPYDLPDEYLTMYSTDNALESYLDRTRSTRRLELGGGHRPRGGDDPKVKFADEQTNQYDGSIRYVDAAIERLVSHLEASGLWNRTVVIFTSDHGEGLGEHNELGHGHVWNEQMHVPLMVHVPGEAPRRIAQGLSLVDVMPTVLRMVDGRLPVAEFLKQCTGADVLADPMPRPLYYQRPGRKNAFAVEEDGWKYILAGRPDEADQLFHLAEDPYELHDVIADHPERAAALKRRLVQLVSEQRGRGAEFAEGRDQAAMNEPISAKHADELASLGYVDEDERDVDNDGVPDDHDRCPNTPANAMVDRRGCAIDQIGAADPPGRNPGRELADGDDEPPEDDRRPKVGSANPNPANCILITLDTTRADHVNPYATDAPTPELARLASQGTVFLNALSQSNQTNPSHATIMSGLYALHHEAVDNITPINDRIDLLPLAFKRAGRVTAAFPSSAHLSGWIGWRGFDHVEDIPDKPGKFLDARKVTELAMDWLERNQGTPFFLWVHYWDPHVPYAPPAELAKQFYADDPTEGTGPLLTDHPGRARFTHWLPGVRDEAYPLAMYQGEVANTDRHLGRLMKRVDELGLRDTTGVIVVGDHGESLGERQMYYNHAFPFEETLHVPLIVRIPGMPAGVRIDRQVTHMDLAPTIAELYGLDVRNEMPGLSLVSALRGQPSNRITERDLFVHEAGSARQVVIREGNLKCYYTLIRIKAFPPLDVAEGDVWVFDLSKDPNETVNVAGDHADLIRRHRELLQPWIEQKLRWRAKRATDVIEKGGRISKQRRALLDSLGYLEDDDE